MRSFHRRRNGMERLLSFGIALLGIYVSMLWLKIPFLNDKTHTKSFSFHPELYHGEGISHHFFEGWYHKLVRTRVACKELNENKNLNNENRTIQLGNNSDQSLSMAVVPGVFYDSGNGEKNESHAFIFVTINGEKQHYYRFDLDTEFRYKRLEQNDHDGIQNENGNIEANDDYYVEIGNNRFSKNGMYLDLVPRVHTKLQNTRFSVDNDDASISLRGVVQYNKLSPWPIPSRWNLGAMGPVGFFLSPFLECYHDVLSFDHLVEGNLTISTWRKEQSYASGTGNPNNFDYGTEIEITTEEFFTSDCDNKQQETTASNCITSRGYVEKDRGRSFPSLWIWMQTNTFGKDSENRGTSLFFSVARIPILVANILGDNVFSSLLEGLLPQTWDVPEFPGFTAALWVNDDTVVQNEDCTTHSIEEDKKMQLIPFATWTGAFFEDLTIDDEAISVVLNSGGIKGGLWAALLPSASSYNREYSMIIRLGRYVKAWVGSWFVDYDSSRFRYRLEIVADRNVPHVMLYAPRTRPVPSDIESVESQSASSTTTSRMEPFVNEALNAKIKVRLYEYHTSISENGIEEEHTRVLLDDVGEHAGLEVHQNVHYLVENLCGKPTANPFTCL